MNGRFFQITPAGEIVWEYVSPYFGPQPLGYAGKTVQANAVYRAQPVPYDWVPAGTPHGEHAVLPPTLRTSECLRNADRGLADNPNGLRRVVDNRSVLAQSGPPQSASPAGFRPSELGVGLQGAGGFSPDQPPIPNGCHICEVEIDPETGEATLDRYTVVDDIGTVINPLLAKGQIQGGVARSAGQALSEDVVYDPDSDPCDG